MGWEWLRTYRRRLGCARRPASSLLLLIGTAVAGCGSGSSSVPPVCDKAQGQGTPIVTPAHAPYPRPGTMVFSTDLCNLALRRGYTTSFSPTDNVAWLAYFPHPVSRFSFHVLRYQSGHWHTLYNSPTPPAEPTKPPWRTDGRQIAPGASTRGSGPSPFETPGRFMITYTASGTTIARGTLTVQG